MAQSDKTFCPLWLSLVAHLCKMIISPIVFFNFSVLIFSFDFQVWFSVGHKRAKMAQNDKKFCHASYLRNDKSYHHNLWYVCVKWYISRHFFHYYQNFGFPDCQWGKVQTVHRALYLRNDTSYLYWWYRCVKG